MPTIAWCDQKFLFLVEDAPAIDLNKNWLRSISWTARLFALSKREAFASGEK